MNQPNSDDARFRRPMPPADDAAALAAGWVKPLPESPPRRTPWPAVMALGVGVTFWGLLLDYIVLASGLIVFFAAVFGWAGEMLRDQRKQSR